MSAQWERAELGVVASWLVLELAQRSTISKKVQLPREHARQLTQHANPLYPLLPSSSVSWDSSSASPLR